MDQREYIATEYIKGRSTSDIGRELGKNSKTIRDTLMRLMIPIRGHSEAQKLNIEKNGAPNDQPHSEETKKKIAKGVKKARGGEISTENP